MGKRLGGGREQLFECVPEQECVSFQNETEKRVKKNNSFFHLHKLIQNSRP